MKTYRIVAATTLAAAISIPAIAGTNMTMNHDNKQIRRISDRINSPSY